MEPLNWTVIYDACPEYLPNHWDFLLTILAIVGVVFGCILFVRLRKQKEKCVYLTVLSGYDCWICYYYLWSYTYTSIAMYFECDILAQLRIAFTREVRGLKAYYDLVVIFVIFFIVIERYLWTCSSKSRQTSKIFTVARNKLWIMIGSVIYSIVSAIFMSGRFEETSDVPFCNSVMRVTLSQNPIVKFLQADLPAWIYVMISIATLAFAVVTLGRVRHVGRGESALEQEDINLESQEETTPKLTTSNIKRSILCMIFVFFLFFVRNMFWDHHGKPTANSEEPRHNRIMTNWTYDVVNVILSGSRILVYYVFCKNEMVVEYPANAKLMK